MKTNQQPHWIEKNTLVSSFNAGIYVIFYVNILCVGCVKTLGAIRHMGVTAEGTQTKHLYQYAR